jgi:uncharacterized protein YprB with RNaseH-like and TPR domain
MNRITVDGFCDAFFGEETANEAGAFYLARQEAGRLADNGARIAEGLRDAFGRRPRSLPLESHLFLDIETTGLGGSSPLFLVGTMCAEEGGDFELRLHFARDFSEEAAVLAHLGRWWKGFPALVTFNGRSFDLPYIQERMWRHGLDYSSPPRHTDVLVLARRAWRYAVPNCKLQTLETCICGRQREDDLPSHLIPAAYRHYVRTGDVGRIRDIFRHNALDLLTTAELLLRLSAPESATSTG